MLPLKEEGLDLRSEGRRVTTNMASRDVGLACGMNSFVELF